MTRKKFDEFVDKLQQEVIEKEKEDYNEYIVELFHNPVNLGRLPQDEITVSQSYTGPCGDTMQFFLKIKNDTIIKANFITDGCGASLATACQTTMLIEGKNIEYTEKLTPEDIDNALKGLPEDHKHCAELAIKTLRRAIEKYKRNYHS